MNKLTGIVAAAALSLAAGAKADEQQAEDSVVRHANVSYSTGYLGELDSHDSSVLMGFAASAHFVPCEFFDGELNLGIDAEASIYAVFGDETGIMLQQKAAVGLEAPAEFFTPFAYVGAGLSVIDQQRAYFTLFQGVDFNLGQEADSPAYYLGIEHGGLFNGEDSAYYFMLNLGLKI